MANLLCARKLGHASSYLKRALQCQRHSHLAGAQFCGISSGILNGLKAYSSKAAGSDIIGIDLGTTNSCVAVMEGKLGNRFFSKVSSQRKAPGKVTNAPEKEINFQGQSIGGQAPSSAADVHEGQGKSSKASGQSSSNYILIIGACSALVIGLVAFFPWDLLKSYYVGERKDADALLKDFKEKNTKGVVLPSKKEQEAEEEKHVLEDLKHSPLVQNQEPENAGFEQGKEIHNKETGDTQSTKPLNKSSNEFTYPDATDSIVVQNVFSSDHVREKISATMSKEDKTSDAESKAEVSQLSGLTNEDLSRGGLSPGSLLDDSKGDHSSVISERKGEVVPISFKQSESSTEDLVNDRDSTIIQTPSSSVTRRPSLLEAYYLGDSTIICIQNNGKVTENKNDLNPDRHEGSVKADNVKGEDFVNKLHIEGVQNVLDLLDVVHAAEKRQAELDAQLYTEAQKRLKQAFQKELKDAQAKELMYAEEASRLAKEIELEKEKAGAALELEQNMARERLFEELKLKDEEANLKLKKADLLSKTEIAAAVAEEKLSYIKDVRDVKQELEALYTVLSTQSNEFRQSHTIHKLAVGTFALEDAMKRGAPIEKEVTLICSSYKGGGADPLLDAIISSLPKHAVKKGTLTPSQLQQKFENLKTGVLELSLIPSTGGGLISHGVAKVVSALKVKESGQFSDGVAAIVSRVQQCLADGKLAEAAELLEKGVHGTKAELLVADWIKNAKERAIMEQMLLLLQAHTTAVASSAA